MLRRILYPYIAVSVWLLYMELKKQRENFYSIGRRGARGVLPVIGGATSSKKAKKSTKRRYQGAWSGWLKERYPLALESDKKEVEKMVQEEEQRLEEFLSREMEKSESEKRLLRRILYPYIAVSVWLLYMELKKQRVN